MRNAPGVVRWAAMSVLLAATGCMSLGRESPPLEQYVLGGGPAAGGAAASQDGAGMTIGIRRIALASYLATPAIVVRHGANQIVVSDFHRWAEDVGEGINRAVARRLAAADAVRAVAIAPWGVRARHDYLLQLHVTRFEGMAEPVAAEGSARVTATWEVIRPEDGTVAARGSTDYLRGGWRVNDYAALVGMLEAGLEELATDVLGCLARVVQAEAVNGGGGSRSYMTCGGALSRSTIE
jgi:uncharacterized lipoprotein YmbA